MTKRVISITLALLMVFGAISVSVAAAEVKILATKTLKVGETANVGMTDPNTGAKINSIWESSDPSIATVTATGTVKAKKAGTCIMSTWWNSKLYGVKVIVKSAAKKIALNKKSATIYVGRKLTLKLKNATASKVKWSTSNKKIATVTSKGVVKGKKAGKATITAKYSGKKYTCKVTVKKKKSGMTTAQAFTKVKNFVVKKGKYSSYEGGVYTYTFGTVSSFNYKISYYKSENCLAYYGTYGKQGVALYVTNNTKAHSAFYEYNNSGGYSKLYYTANFKKSSYKYKTTKLTYKGASGADNNMAVGMLSWAFGEFNNCTKKKAGVTMKQLGFTNWDK